MRASLDRIVYTTQTSPAKAAELKKKAAAEDLARTSLHTDGFDRKKKPRPNDNQPMPGQIDGVYDPVKDAPHVPPEKLKELRDQALVDALRAVYAKHKVIGYSEARGIIFRVIDNLDGIVNCVYTNRQEQATGQPGGMNIEHTWPQSKGAKGAAKSDMFHLFPTDIDANSTRSSYPFGNIVGNPEWTEGGSKLGNDEKGRTVFQPRPEHQGNVARAMFYFSTVYNMDIPPEEEAVLRAWDKADPVDANELERNNRIEKYQGNRNPFIDDPSLADLIKDF